MTVRIVFLTAFVAGMDVLFWATPSITWGVYASVAGIVSGAVLASYGVLITIMTLRARMPKTDRLFHVVVAIAAGLFGLVTLLGLIGIWVSALGVRAELEGLI